MSCLSGKASISRRALLGAAACGFSALLTARRAQATLFRGISLQDLARASEHVLVCTALEASAHWEVLGGRRRIVTDTRVRVEDVVAKAIPAEGELFVRTLGGTVGDQAALVLGEAALFLNQSSVLFMVREESVFRVLGMAQGHYPLVADSKQVLRLTQSPRAPELLVSGEPAMHVLPGLELERARSVIQAALGQ